MSIRSTAHEPCVEYCSDILNREGRHTDDWKNWPVSWSATKLVTPGADLGPLPSKSISSQIWIIAECELTSGGMTIVGEEGLGGCDDGLLIDGLGRPFDPHVDRGVGCASLDDRSRGGGGGHNEQREGG